MKEIVLDASVVLKWYLPDEEFGNKALRILHRHVMDGDLELFSSTILPYEVLNALLVAERRGRIDQKVTAEAFYTFLEVGIHYQDAFFDYSEFLSFARTFERSVYDASYLCLAKKRNIDFVTGDRRLYNAAKGKLKWVRWIGSLQRL